MHTTTKGNKMSNANEYETKNWTVEKNGRVIMTDTHERCEHYKIHAADRDECELVELK